MRGIRNAVPRIPVMVIILLPIALLMLVLGLINYALVHSYSPKLYLAGCSAISILGLCTLMILTARLGFDIKETFQIGPLNRSTIQIVLLAAVGHFLFLSGLISCLLSIFPSREILQIMLSNRPEDLIGWLLTVTNGVILGPVLEELIFRGLIQSSIRLRYGAVASLIIPAILFGMIHVLPVSITVVAVSGVMFGYVVHKTKSLAGSIIMHSAGNLFGYVFNSLQFKQIPDKIDIDLRYAVPCLFVGMVLLGYGLWSLNRTVIRDSIGPIRHG